MGWGWGGAGGGGVTVIGCPGVRGSVACVVFFVWWVGAQEGLRGVSNQQGRLVGVICGGVHLQANRINRVLSPVQNMAVSGAMLFE